MALSITYAWSTSVYMENSLQACTQSRLIASPVNMHIKFALHAEETCGASGITSAHQQKLSLCKLTSCNVQPAGLFLKVFVL